MANVDPFVIQWPREWVEDPEIGPVIHYLNRFLHDLWLRTGGPSDSIAATEVAEKYPWPTTNITKNDSFDYPTKVIPDKQYNAVTVTSSYTAVSWDFVNAKVSATITFPEYPNENDVIIVRNGDGTTINLDGNGKNINGKTKGVLRNKETSILFHYFIDSDEWLVR